VAAFRPAYDDHAIDAVIFQLIFDTPLGPGDFAAVEAQHLKWREELPALQTGQADPIRLPGFLALPPQTTGVSFAHLRPDGLPAWQIRFDPGSISVLCTRFIRWERVWKTAARYLGKALELIAAQPGGDRRLTAAMLQMAERFVSPAEGYDAGQLLRPGAHVPHALFGLGPVWHNNMGWFERSSAAGEADGEVLHNLNIASNPSALPDTTTQEAMMGIGITHIQEWRLAPPGTLADIAALTERLNAAMPALHVANRRLIAELLTPEMAKRAG